MCHDKEDSLLPRRTRDSGVYFRGIGRGNGTMSSSHQPVQSKSKMAPHGVVEGQVGRWVPDTLWHVHAKSPVMSEFDSVHFVGEDLTWQVGRDANDHFLCLLFFFFWFHESQRLAGESYLSIHDCKTGLPGPFLGRIDGLVIDRFLWKTTCKQIGKVKVSVFAILEVWWKWESFTCLIGLPSNTNVASHIALNQFILIFEFWINSMNLQIDSSETFWDL